MKLIECPRDAMQGIKEFIPTEKKVNYINQLLKVGYDAIDFGSFVSAKAIPQMSDTVEVLEKLDFNGSNTKLLAIVANLRGALNASEFDQITYLGYPFSISETFQLRNTNADIEESLIRVEGILDICEKKNKILNTYLSMGFGNPYNDDWSFEIVEYWVARLSVLGVTHISLSDTIGVSTRDSIQYLFQHLIPKYPNISFGAHLHTRPDQWFDKVDAAVKGGCQKLDVVIKGYGGCPMADDELVGNMITERVVEYLNQNKIIHSLNLEELNKAIILTQNIFPQH